MAIAHCVCTAVYLALSSDPSLISSDGGIPTSTTAPPAADPCGAQAQKKKRREERKWGSGKVANGEAHRQEEGVISSGNYQSHFLYDLSD